MGSFKIMAFASTHPAIISGWADMTRQKLRDCSDACGLDVVRLIGMRLLFKTACPIASKRPRAAVIMARLPLLTGRAKPSASSRALLAVKVWPAALLPLMLA